VSADFPWPVDVESGPAAIVAQIRVDSKSARAVRTPPVYRVADVLATPIRGHGDDIGQLGGHRLPRGRQELPFVTHRVSETERI